MAAEPGHWLGPHPRRQPSVRLGDQGAVRTLAGTEGSGCPPAAPSTFAQSHFPAREAPTGRYFLLHFHFPKLVPSHSLRASSSHFCQLHHFLRRRPAGRGLACSPDRQGQLGPQE